MLTHRLIQKAAGEAATHGLLLASGISWPKSRHLVGTNSDGESDLDDLPDLLETASL
jgi:hypothetical protein